MKKLLIVSLLAGTSACAPVKVKAPPRPTLKPTVVQYSPWKEGKRGDEKPLDHHRSKNGTMMLHSNGVDFMDDEKIPGGPSSSFFPSNIVFNQPAVAGRFLDNGRKAIVLFENGKLSRFGFDNNVAPTFQLFSRLPNNPPGILVSGNVYWFVLIGSPDVVRVRWKGEKDVDAVRRFRFKKIAAIKKQTNVKCTKERCRFYEGQKLIDEAKEVKQP